MVSLQRQEKQQQGYVFKIKTGQITEALLFKVTG
jgi:hypothetical protein